MSSLDALLYGYKWVANAATRLLQRSALNFPAGSGLVAVDNPTLQTTDVYAGQGMVDPSIIDGSSLAPSSLPSGATFALDSDQGTVLVLTGSSATVCGSCPLPGSTGTPIPGTGSPGTTPPAKGTLSLFVDVYARMPSGADAGYWARWVYSVSCDVETAGTTAPTSLTAVQQFADGSNSGAAPSGWSVSIALDVTNPSSTAIQTSVTAAANVVVRTKQTASYLQ